MPASDPRYQELTDMGDGPIFYTVLAQIERV